MFIGAVVIQTIVMQFCGIRRTQANSTSYGNTNTSREMGRKKEVVQDQKKLQKIKYEINAVFSISGFMNEYKDNPTLYPIVGDYLAE